MQEPGDEQTRCTCLAAPASLRLAHCAWPAVPAPAPSPCSTAKFNSWFNVEVKENTEVSRVQPRLLGQGKRKAMRGNAFA